MRAWTLAPIAMLAIASTARTQPPRFIATELPTRVDDRLGYPLDLNNDGWVLSEGDAGPSLYRDGVIKTPLDETYHTHSLSDAGHIVGRRRVPWDDPYIWDGKTLQVLETAPYGSDGDVYAVNRHGVAVGFIENHTVIWRGGQPELLYFGEGRGTIGDINSAGDVVGSVRGGDPYSRHGLLYRNGQRRFLDSVPGADPTETLITLSSINEDGLIAGSAGNPNYPFAAGTAFVYDGDSLTLLADRSADERMTALDINGSNWVVGGALLHRNNRREQEAVLWVEDEIYDLHDLIVNGMDDDYLNRAIAVNDRGQILAVASRNVFGDGYQTAYLLTPVPSPAGATLLLALFATRRRRPAPTPRH